MGRLPCLMLVMSLILVFPYNGEDVRSGPTSSMIVPTFEGLDQDGDRIDDRISFLDPACILDGRFGINVHFFYTPGSDDREGIMSALRSIGADPEFIREGGMVDAFYLNVDPGSSSNIASMTLPRTVRFIELRPPMVPTLDVSAPAIRARASTMYTPYTVEDLGIDGTGINIAVVDTGVDNTFHETFRGRAEYGIDFTGPTVVYGTDPDDVDGHGTHVAGIVLGDGGTNGRYRGIAPAAGLVDLRIARIFGDASGNLDLALQWLIENHEDQDIRVVSISFGSTVNSPGTDTTSTLANALVDDGVVVVVAAGNAGVQGLPSPASADEVITVAACDDQDTVDRGDDPWASYSNYGPRDPDGDSDGYDELKPDLLAPGSNIYSAAPNTVNAYVSKTGTSMSCPHVSGIAALMLQANPDLGPDSVKSILRKTAEQKISPASYPDLDPKYNTASGWGFVDAFGAVRRSMDLRSTDLMVPSEVMAGSMVDISIHMNYTKTDYNTGNEKVDFKFETPANFGKPEGMSVNTGSMDASYELKGPINTGDVWITSAFITYTATVRDALPSFSLKLRAPATVGETGGVVGWSYIDEDPGRSDWILMTTVENISPSDLSIVPFAIWFSESFPDGGQNVDITVKVNNTGRGAASNCLVRVIDGPQRTGETIGESIVDIPSEGSALITVTWEANPGVHAITAVADPENVISESVETNNSAERPITVRGINPPPIARIDSDTNRTTVLTDVTFDASSSSDTNVRGGNVVSYLFDFGDGTGSGWINSSVSVHAYRDPGSYMASVVVRDNGGAESVNDASVDVEVTDLSSEEMRLYLDPSFSMVENGVADGGIPFGPVNGTTIGTWSSAPFGVTTDMLVKAVLELFVSSSGAIVSIDAALLDDSGVIEDSGIGPIRVVGSKVRLNITIPTRDARIEYDHGIYLRLTVDADSQATLEMGEGLSSLLLYPRPAANQLPKSNAGPDLEVKAGDPVLFEGSGTDPDGAIIDARWDVDADGIWDVEGAASTVYSYPGYTRSGNYTATLEVRDDKGAWGRDTAQVVAWPSDFNFPPEVSIDIQPGSNLSGEVDLIGGSSDDGTVLRVEVMVESGEITAVQWTAASGTDPWSYQWDTVGFPDGEYTISARAFDGDKYSDIARAKVTVFNPVHGPRITEFSADPEALMLDGETSVAFLLKVTDDDLPEDRITVALDLSDIGGGSSVRPEEISSSGTEVQFRYDFVPPQEIAGGKVVVSAEVEDSGGLKDSSQATMELVNLNTIRFETAPSTVRADEYMVIAVRVEGGSQGYKVHANSTAFVAQASLYDDGKDPDRSRDDDVFTGKAMVRSVSGRHTLQVEVFGPDGDLVGRISKDIMVSARLSEGAAVPPVLIVGIVALVLMVLIAVVGVIVYIKASASEGRTVGPSSGAVKSKKAVDAIELV